MPGPAIISVLIVLIVQQRFSTEHSTPRARWGVVGVVRCWCCPLLVLSAAGVVRCWCKPSKKYYSRAAYDPTVLVMSCSCGYSSNSITNGEDPHNACYCQSLLLILIIAGDVVTFPQRSNHYRQRSAVLLTTLSERTSKPILVVSYLHLTLLSLTLPDSIFIGL